MIVDPTTNRSKTQIIFLFSETSKLTNSLRIYSTTTTTSKGERGGEGRRSNNDDDDDDDGYTLSIYAINISLSIYLSTTTTTTMIPTIILY